ncbi:MAG: hypothetical protein FWC01_00155 [Treponema sp.]|nr:hypothetical protein [Treponema sp.]MCL2236668.1 hypothetical protein [Treponema sp.]
MNERKCFFTILFLLVFVFCFGESEIETATEAQSHSDEQRQETEFGFEISSGSSFYASRINDEYSSYYGIPLQLHANRFDKSKIVYELCVGIILITDAASVSPEGGLLLKSGSDVLILGLDAYAGFGSYVFFNDKWKIPFTAGIHFRMNAIGFGSGNNFIEYYDYNFGVGFCLTLQYHFNCNIYFFMKVQGTFDFISHYEEIMTVNGIEYGSRGTEFGASWGLSPLLGIGFKI